MKVLSLDPSSTIIGYAVLDFDSETILQAGLCKPHKSGMKPIPRVLSLIGDLSGLLREHEPGVVVIEVPDAKQYTRKHERTTSLPVWSFAAGAYFGWLEARMDGRDVYPVSNTLWTKGHSKPARVVKAGLLHRDYDAEHDPGADMADAICLGAWWIRQQKGNDRLAAALRKGTR